MPAEGSLKDNLQITINGQTRPFSESLSLKKLLQEFKIDSQSIAVAVNGEVIPRSLIEPYVVKAGDTIEVIRAVGGG